MQHTMLYIPIYTRNKGPGGSKNKGYQCTKYHFSQFLAPPNVFKFLDYNN